jgi:uncharacterized protein YbaR (Trm112 family)
MTILKNDNMDRHESLKNDELVKVFFLKSMDEDTYETESLWCIKDGENYIIDNIPLIAPRISLGDTISAEYDKEEDALYFEAL